MQRWRRSIPDESGSASLEFITTGLVLLLPLVYLVLTMSALQAGSLAAEGAARQAARVFVQSGTEADAAASAERAIEYAMADYGLAGQQPVVRVSCSPQPEDCLHRLGHVTVSVGIAVALPLVPSVLSLSVPMRIPLQATATEQVSRFWGSH